MYCHPRENHLLARSLARWYLVRHQGSSNSSGWLAQGPSPREHSASAALCLYAWVRMLTARSLSPPTSFALSQNLSVFSLPRAALLSPPPSPTYARKKRYAIPAERVTVHSHTVNTPAPRDLTCGRLALVIGVGEGEGGDDAWEIGRPIHPWVTPDTTNRKVQDRRSTLEHPRLLLRPVASISTPRCESPVA